MNKNIKFSIIMCAYNVEEYIKRAIESVYKQDYKNYELIIVNDGSTDETLKKVRQAKKEYKISNMFIINNRKNIGLGGARNIGAKKAKGEYILYLDSDDTLYEDSTLDKINEVTIKESPDIIYMGVQYVGGSNKAYIPNAENSTKEARIACDMHFAVSSKCFKRKFLKENDIEFLTNVYYEDMVYSIKSTILAQKISYGEFIFYNYYRNRDGSIMSTPSIKRCTDMYKMLENVMKLYEITPDEYKPYLMSFIRNETRNTIEKIDIILNSIENGDLLKTMPKRNYKLDFGKLNGLQGEMKHAN